MPQRTGSESSWGSCRPPWGLPSASSALGGTKPGLQLLLWPHACYSLHQLHSPSSDTLFIALCLSYFLAALFFPLFKVSELHVWNEKCKSWDGIFFVFLINSLRIQLIKGEMGKNIRINEDRVTFISSAVKKKKKTTVLWLCKSATHQNAEIYITENKIPHSYASVTLQDSCTLIVWLTVIKWSHSLYSESNIR